MSVSRVTMTGDPAESAALGTLRALAFRFPASPLIPLGRPLCTVPLVVAGASMARHAAAVAAR